VALFRNQKIDVLQSAYKNRERKHYGRFTKPYYKDRTVFVVSRDRNDIFDISDLDGKIVAAPKGWAYESFLLENYPEIHLLSVGNMAQAFDAVIKKKADAVIELSAVARYRMKKHFLEDLKITGWFNQYDNNRQKALRILVRKDWPVFHAMLEKALETVTPGDIAVLEQKWLGKGALDSGENMNLTPDEEIFLRNHPVIRVANELDWPPFDFVENGRPTGFAIDYARLLARTIGVDLEFVNGHTWSQLLEMGRQNQVDLFPGLWKSSERETFLTFTRSYVELVKVLATRKDLKQVETLSDMKGKTIAMPHGYTLTEAIMNENPGFDYMLVDNPQEGLKQVSLGKADGFVGSLGIINYLIKKHFLDNVTVVAEVQLDHSLPLYMAVRKDMAPLASILDKAMDHVSTGQYQEIVEKWIGSMAIGREGPGNLTRREKEYLEEKKQLVLSVQAENLPFESVDEKGQYTGIVADFYRSMEEKLGLPMDIVPCNSFQEAETMLAKGRCDMISMVGQNAADGKTYRVTEPYVEYPLVIATGSKAIYINSLDEIAEKKIGVSRNAWFFDQLTAWYPHIEFQAVDSLEQGLSKVQSEELFAVVDMAPKIGFYIQEKQMVDLKISGELPYDVPLRGGIAGREKILLTVFEKTVNSLDKAEKKEIFQSWITLKYQQDFDYSLLWKILLVLGIIGVFFLYRHISVARYNVELAGLNKKLTRANKKLETISYMDGLTGIPNRRNFDAVLKKEWHRCRRNRGFLTVIMIDIDYFKRYNDLYGHLAGDDCLKRVAALIDEVPGRPGDFVARYGGEEFVIVLPDTDRNGAELIAGKILSDVRKLEIVHEDSDVSRWLTVSIGVACVVPGKKNSSMKLVEAADQALYRAKEAGRNQFRAAEQPGRFGRF
ncbi:MAG TPA: transporter substrate-binding domain-containing protein, partial [Desulfobacteraceae bacterium]|nr:transporter substrate-binding domain-containing protein [Desulfobacteraceae bacterium]